MGKKTPFAVTADQISSNNLPVPESLSGLVEVLRTLTDAPVAIAVTAGPDHRFIFANANYCQAFGGDRQPIVGRKPDEVFQPMAGETLARLDRVRATGQRLFLHEDETPLASEPSFWDVEYAPYRAGTGELVEAVIITARNVTEQVAARKRAATLAAEAMRHAAAAWESEQRFQVMAEAVPAILFTAKPGGQIDFFNQRFVEYTGMTTEDALDLAGWLAALHPDDVAQNQERWRLAEARGEPFENEYRLRRADGTYRWFVARSLPVRGEDNRIVKWVGSCTDIDDLKRLNQGLRKAAKQKEVLLREVNHRIKNSLQLIAGLLMLQSRTVPVEVRERFTEAVDRIHAVARVYQRLYQTADFEAVAFGPYLREFCANLADTLSSRERGVTLSVDTAEILLPADQVIPLGLIVNELVTNAFKYALPDGGGSVRVECLEDTGGSLRITVADDGIGLPRDFRPEASRTVGMKVVSGLTKQLKGRFEVVPTDRGATFRVCVPMQRIAS